MTQFSGAAHGKSAILKHTSYSQMWLILSRTIPAPGKRSRCLGPVFRPFTNSDQHSFQILYAISMFRQFLDKIKLLKCARNIYWPFIRANRLSKTDKCRTCEIKRCIQLTLDSNTDVAETRGYFEPRSTWHRGLVVRVSGYESRGPGANPGCANILVCFYLPF